MMTEFFIIALSAYGICTLFAVVVYFIEFDDWKYHLRANGKLLIPYLISGVIVLIICVKWAISIYGIK